jgi:hypothetical protein
VNAHPPKISFFKKPAALWIMQILCILGIYLSIKATINQTHFSHINTAILDTTAAAICAYLCIGIEKRHIMARWLAVTIYLFSALLVVASNLSYLNNMHTSDQVLFITMASISGFTFLLLAGIAAFSHSVKAYFAHLTASHHT